MKEEMARESGQGATGTGTAAATTRTSIDASIRAAKRSSKPLALGLPESKPTKRSKEAATAKGKGKKRSSTSFKVTGKKHGFSNDLGERRTRTAAAGAAAGKGAKGPRGAKDGKGSTNGKTKGKRSS